MGPIIAPFKLKMALHGAQLRVRPPLALGGRGGGPKFKISKLWHIRNALLSYPQRTVFLLVEHDSRERTHRPDIQTYAICRPMRNRAAQFDKIRLNHLKE